MKKIGIVGATGYTGAELIRILLNHPKVKITSLTAKIDKAEPISKIFPQFKGVFDMECGVFKNVGEVASKVDLVFLAVPHTVALKMVPEFLKKGVKVIDLSADYRFDEAKTYEKWYGLKHTYSQLLKKKVYGLPEIYRAQIKKAELIANPGCYPTSVILGAYPLVKMGLANEILVNSLSGVSGAGRTADLSLIFSEIEGNLKAYKVGIHRHQPEMEEQLSKITGSNVKVTFVPHLVPIARGILTTMYIKLTRPTDKNKILQVYKNTYKNEPFAQLLPEMESPQIKMVNGTNKCQISIIIKNDLAIVITAIDNLIKGASGQAVQNMNLMYGWDETEGLLNIPIYP
jgi:N-acetyl-gamma-glutamyl-phosphate reductase